MVGTHTVQSIAESDLERWGKKLREVRGTNREAGKRRVYGHTRPAISNDPGIRIRIRINKMM